MRGQVVFALEKAEDIKSVRLVCENQWEERTGVRNGRARFENVPSVECQVGWIGDRKGWFKIPAEWSLVQCIFETTALTANRFNRHPSYSWKALKSIPAWQGNARS